jgi:hypothetical protein
MVALGIFLQNSKTCKLFDLKTNREVFMKKMSLIVSLVSILLSAQAVAAAELNDKCLAAIAGSVEGHKNAVAAKEDGALTTEQYAEQLMIEVETVDQQAKSCSLAYAEAERAEVIALFKAKYNADIEGN